MVKANWIATLRTWLSMLKSSRHFDRQGASRLIGILATPFPFAFWPDWPGLVGGLIRTVAWSLELLDELDAGKGCKCNGGRAKSSSYGCRALE